ncbi:MAG: ATP-binding protein, partial [Eubacterium sp.]|nr:ATP-binding protein [Eubacterium sp.]
EIMISRAGGVFSYPASFLLVAAMNPCPCGYYPDRNRCSCSPREVQHYQGRISQALLDRIDLRCEVPAAEYQDLTGNGTASVSSEELRDQVQAACLIQKERFNESAVYFNSEMHAPDIHRFCGRSPEAERMLEAAYKSLRMSARGYHHVLRVARTIADLEDSGEIKEAHIAEALCFRCEETDVLFTEGCG